MTLAGWVLLFAVLLASTVAVGISARRAGRSRKELAAARRDLHSVKRSLDEARAELEALTYAVSHDLRAPLRAIDGFSRIVDERYGRYLDDEGRRLIGLVRDSARRMGRQIESLLALASMERRSLYPVELDMRALAAEAWVDVAGESGLSCTVAALPPARGDSALLRQVWTNLLANAVKYSARREAPRIEVAGSQAGGECVYCVSDNGAGFDMRQAGRLFKLFQRLHPESEFPGTGIGLAMVARIVSRHGGRVWAESAPGAGAKFYFTLPGGQS